MSKKINSKKQNIKHAKEYNFGHEYDKHTYIPTAEDEFDFYNISGNILFQPNIRNNKITYFTERYAPDINCDIDIDRIKQNLDNFELIGMNEGFTSRVYIYEYENVKIVKKIYKKEIKNKNYYINYDHIKESFNNELSTLSILQNELYFPKLICYNEDILSITMTHVGDILATKREMINLDIIPINWKEQLYYILCILKKHNLYHNDITERNMCLLNNRLYLIDYGNCKKHIDTYYRNFYSGLLRRSNNIIDFFTVIDTNANEIRRCNHGTFNEII